MIIDYKYHIASIAAIFVALGLGVMIGSTTLGNDINAALVQQHDKLYENLKLEVEGMRFQKNEAIKRAENTEKMLGISLEFEKKLLPSLISNELTGEKIAVVQLDQFTPAQDWMSTLEASGADIVSQTVLTDNKKFNDPEVRKLLASKLMLSDTSKRTLMRSVAVEIAEGIKSAQNFENLEYLEHMKLLKSSGTYGTPIDWVILIGGSSTIDSQRCFDLDLPLAKAFQDTNMPVIFGEYAAIGQSYMDTYRRLKMRAVENVDTIPGQVSLVRAITGKN